MPKHSGQIKFTVELHELEEAQQDAYLRGIIQGEKNIEEIRMNENLLWQELTTKLRKLAESKGATFEDIDSCWRVPEPTKTPSKEKKS